MRHRNARHQFGEEPTEFGEQLQFDLDWGPFEEEDEDEIERSKRRHPSQGSLLSFRDVIDEPETTDNVVDEYEMWCEFNAVNSDKMGSTEYIEEFIDGMRYGDSERFELELVYANRLAALEQELLPAEFRADEQTTDEQITDEQVTHAGGYH